MLFAKIFPLLVPTRGHHAVLIFLREVSCMISSMDDDCAWFGSGNCCPLFVPGPARFQEQILLLGWKVFDAYLVRFGLSNEEASRVFVEANISVLCTEYVVLDGALIKYVTVVRDACWRQVALRRRRIREDCWS